MIFSQLTRYLMSTQCEPGSELSARDSVVSKSIIDSHLSCLSNGRVHIGHFIKTKMVACVIQNQRK